MKTKKRYRAKPEISFEKCQVCGGPVYIARRMKSNFPGAKRPRVCILQCFGLWEENNNPQMQVDLSRRLSRAHLKTKCEACGDNRDLEAHHLDQDPTNNEESNIQTLCKYCHGFWHQASLRMKHAIAGRMPSLIS